MGDHSVDLSEKYNGKDPQDITEPQEIVKRSSSKPVDVYSVDEAIEKLGFGPFQWFIYSLCGLLWMADAIEVMVLSILSPAVKCQWKLSSAEEAIITSVVFAGSLLGSLLWGVLGDNYGRKVTLLLANITILVSGILSSIPLTDDDRRLPGYPWLLLCRFGVGVGASGITQVGPYFIEFLPRKARAICVIFVSGWWAVGTMFGAALAVAVMRPGGLGWHWYLGLCAIPAALGLLYFPFIPESARYHLVHGNEEKAKKVLKRVAWWNRKQLPDGKLILVRTENESIGKKKDTIHVENDESSFYQDDQAKSGMHNSDDEKHPLLGSKDCDQSMVETQTLKTKSKFVGGIKSLPLLVKNGMWKVTILLTLLWFGAIWLYYGNVLLTSSILQENPHCDYIYENATFINETDFSNSTCERQLDTNDYLSIMWTTAAELPGLLVTMLIIECFGRKLTMVFNFSIMLIGHGLLFICTVEIVLTFFLFLIRAFATGLVQTMYVYTPEVYPTKIRGIGVSVCYAVARVGAISTPYVAQVLFQTSDLATISLYAGSCLVLILFSILLPIETKGKALKDH